MSLLNLTKAKILPTLIGELADAIAADVGNEQIGGAFLDSAHGDVRPIVDLVDLCSNLAEVSDGGVAAAAAQLEENLAAGTNGLIVKHETDPDFEGLHGLGIFVPAVTSGGDLKRLEVREEDYTRLALVNPAGNRWAQTAYHDLATLLEATNAAVAEMVVRAGASSRADREGVAQLLVGITRSFTKLEEAATRVEEQVVGVLDNPKAVSRARVGEEGLVRRPTLPAADARERAAATGEIGGRAGAAPPAGPAGRRRHAPASRPRSAISRMCLPPRNARCGGC